MRCPKCQSHHIGLLKDKTGYFCSDCEYVFFDDDRAPRNKTSPVTIAIAVIFGLICIAILANWEDFLEEANKEVCNQSEFCRSMNDAKRKTKQFQDEIERLREAEKHKPQQ